MSVKVIVRQRIELTEPQLDLLRFFAGRQDPPTRLRLSMYAALRTQKLIRQERRRPVYSITDLGRHVLAQLERFEATTS